MIENTEKRGEELERFGASSHPGPTFLRLAKTSKRETLQLKAATRLNAYHLGLVVALGYI